MIAMPFRVPLRVRYSEIDYQGIAYNAHYLTWMDIGIHEFFRALPYDYTAKRAETGCDFHTVKACIAFKRPLRLDDDFVVELRLGRVGRSSLTFLLDLRVEGEADARAQGELVWVHADPATGRSAPLPGELLDLLVRP
jgi:acyl-CoA thioester hydrolase